MSPTHTTSKSEGSPESNSPFTISKPCSPPLNPFQKPTDRTTTGWGKRSLTAPVKRGLFLCCYLLIIASFSVCDAAAHLLLPHPAFFHAKDWARWRSRKKSQDSVPSGQTHTMTAKKRYSQLSSVTAWWLTETYAFYTWCSVLFKQTYAPPIAAPAVGAGPAADLQPGNLLETQVSVFCADLPTSGLRDILPLSSAGQQTMILKALPHYKKIHVNCIKFKVQEKS